MNEERVKKYIVWVDEHYASFLKFRKVDPEKAEAELKYLEDCIDKLVEIKNQ